MRPSLSGSPATPPVSSGSLTCPYGLGQTSRYIIFDLFFPSYFFLAGDRHLHLSLALRLRHAGSPLSAQALHHPVPASQKRSELLHNRIEKCEDVNFYFHLQGEGHFTQLVRSPQYKIIGFQFPGEMPHWAWAEHEQ